MNALRATLAALVLVSAPSWAHHSTAADFDVTKLIILQGTVREVEWINPHAWLHLDVKDPDSKITVWRIEGGSPEAMAIRKFPKESVTAGIEISITVYPARSGGNLADGATITFKDGKRIFFGGSAPVDGLDKDGKPCILGKRAQGVLSPCQ
jgi:hypothetical protein